MDQLLTDLPADLRRTGWHGNYGPTLDTVRLSFPYWNLLMRYILLSAGLLTLLYVLNNAIVGMMLGPGDPPQLSGGQFASHTPMHGLTKLILVLIVGVWGWWNPLSLRAGASTFTLGYLFIVWLRSVVLSEQPTHPLLAMSDAEWTQLRSDLWPSFLRFMAENLLICAICLLVRFYAWLVQTCGEWSNKRRGRNRPIHN
jgi:hypothetical protein